MQKQDAPQAGPGQTLGPLPALLTAVPGTTSRSRVRVLAALTETREPLSLAALSDATSLHINTLREHLEALQQQGLVSRALAKPHGRGRPAWLYTAARAAAPNGAREYAGLASALADSIRRHSPDPAEEGREAGQTWGRDLAERQGPPAGQGAVAARRHVVGLLDDLGFAPETAGRVTSVRLTRCPLLDAARVNPEVVCSVHRGIVEGALSQWGSSEPVTLLAFSEPGACRLRLGGQSAASPPA
ncbi:MAG: helix-turn-helix domain-containing protein [Humibacillus sp.]|nr:helix-turn-helix domain-containing protein [Humibacillus sp.]MDN5776913.1 helix-turn-helix domain-containing protein [Humibacillus sp.]